MDNCLIATAEGETELHQQMVHKLLDIFKEKLYFLKPSKCEFEKEEVDFLGACLRHGKVAIEPVKLGGIADWPTELHNIKDIRSTLGVLGFQCPFIKNFSTIAKPITDLLKKGTTFLWTDKCRNALQKLKDIVTSEPNSGCSHFIMYPGKSTMPCHNFPPSLLGASSA
jgi:hypothetical protein